jgi:MSHA biogenesis protein MshL
MMWKLPWLGLILGCVLGGPPEDGVPIANEPAAMAELEVDAEIGEEPELEMEPEAEQSSEVQETGRLLAVEVRDTEEGAAVRLWSDGPFDHRKIFILRDPYRLVIDFPGLRYEGPEVVAGSGRHVDRVRLGQSPERVRVVIDAPREGALVQRQYLWLPDGLLVTLGQGGAVRRALAEAAKPPGGVGLEMDAEAESEPAALPFVETKPPQSIEPRTVSRPDNDPRPPVVRLLSQGRYTLNVQDADLPGLLLGLSRDTPVNIVVGPGVQGSVNADLENVSLLEILEQIVRPRGFHYRIEGRTVRIFKTDRETWIFQVDYPNTRRSGSGQFSVSGALAQEIAIAGGSGDSGDTSTSNVSTEQEVDFWKEIEMGVKLIVFGADAGDADSEGGMAHTDGRRVLVSRQAGVLMVTASESLLQETERYVETLVRSLGRQVLLDVRIVEVALNDQLDLGLDVEVSPGYSSGGQNVSGTIERLITGGIARDAATFLQDLAPTLTSGGFTFGIATDSVGVVLNALARQADLRVVSSPRIATLNNHKALIKVVRNEVFYVAEVEVQAFDAVGQTAVTTFVPTITPIGVTLDVTPQVSEYGEITLHVHPSVSEIVEIREQPRLPGQDAVGALPVIDIRETDTVLRVMDGETVVIGGLIQHSELDIERKIPLLGDIPWLGQLFRQTDVEERRSELVIFLTPTVLDPPTIRRVTAEGEQNLSNLDELRLQRRAIRSSWWR